MTFTEGLYEINGVQYTPAKRTDVVPQILLIEKYQLSNFRGDYGAGPVIQTHALAPGERNRFSVKTYSRSTDTRNEGSSILDSNTRQASSDFEETFERESSVKLDTLTADLKNSERGEGSVNVVGIFGGSGSYQKTGQWGTRSEREAFARVVGSSVAKHSHRASSKRNVEVSFSSETTVEQGVETSLEREVENVNVSRTLNLVFRQMVQEFISVLHLREVKFAVYDGSAGPYDEYDVYELDRLFDDYFLPDEDNRELVRLRLLRELYYVFDHEGTARQFLEKVVDFELPADAPAELNFEDPLEYWRVKTPLETDVPDLPGNVKVQGIVTQLSKITIRTDGVVMDAFLGRGDALDDYSEGLQVEAVRDLELKNALLQCEVEAKKLAAKIVTEGDEGLSEIYRKVFVCCSDDDDGPSDSEGGGHNDG